MAIAQFPAVGAAPTPLTLDHLVELTVATADDVRAGAHEFHFDAETRWSVRLRGDDYADVWLITWTTTQATALHDHAGSLGALTVVSGTLLERYWTSGLRDREIPPGTSAGFPLGHVHDVINTRTEPAVTVHAYSPPLTVMSYYRLDATGALRRTRSVLTDDPEPDAVTLSAAPRREAGR